MLQHDYLLEVISQFVETVARALGALRRHPTRGDVATVEEGIAGLLDLDPEVALALTPDSLVTMMLLSGVGDAVAGYVAFSLRQLSDAYGCLGDDDLRELRLSQAQAVEASFTVEPGVIPRELEGRLGHAG
ncbi:hypothetical protein [Olsenella sp. HMSC062G07]|uniref:hypothetical protein n=1 Tax=Olsenella sp. HMSC062G07 TaxID=1739330 RepID=UPI0008A3BDA3|nr:hypothetical protein [Olsenella sp. HMSC062G07]OFK24155.1 hypothetical protein HMPREF2826_08515 [Olsenella sp. HMSC062G07]